MRHDDDQTLRFRCPCCSTAISTTPRQGNRIATCPRCGELLKVPANEPADDEPDQIPPPQLERRRDFGFRCPFCGTTGAPVVERKVSTAGWITFALLLCTTIVLCFIGLFMKDESRRCSSCGIKLD